MGNEVTGSGGERDKSPMRPSAAQHDPQRDSHREPPRCLHSEDLFGGQPEILIVHEGETYRLRVTRNGKLILHK
jgi:hemin uptake protein HemP